MIDTIRDIIYREDGVSAIYLLTTLQVMECRGTPVPVGGIEKLSQYVEGLYPRLIQEYILHEPLVRLLKNLPQWEKCKESHPILSTKILNGWYKHMCNEVDLHKMVSMSVEGGIVDLDLDYLEDNTNITPQIGEFDLYRIYMEAPRIGICFYGDISSGTAWIILDKIGENKYKYVDLPLCLKKDKGYNLLKGLDDLDIFDASLVEF